MTADAQTTRTCEVRGPGCPGGVAEYRKDPVLDEVYGEEAWHWYCDYCWDERKDEV